MNFKKHTILLIEDDRDIRESTAEMLELANFKVHTAATGKKGIELAQSIVPDVVLCDIASAELDGYGVLNLLNKNESTANIPFIFLTSKTDRADIRKGMDMGADDYLTKPFDDIELLNTIDTRLWKHEKALQKSDRVESFEGILNEARSAKLLTELSENCRVRTYKKKEKVYTDKDQPVNVYLVKTGKIRTYMIYEDGREITTGIFSPGRFLGYESVLLDTPYPENAETFDNSELYLIPRNDFNALLFKDKGIARKFIELLSENIQEKQEQLLQLAYSSVRKRVADALLDLAQNEDMKAEANLEIKVSREDLASMAGTAIETISRTLTDFRDERLIEKEGTIIRVLSLERLRKIKQ